MQKQKQGGGNWGNFKGLAESWFWYMIKVESIGPNESIGLDPREAGFAYGMAVFEMMKVAGGRVYFWSRHWRRFQKSIAECFGYNCWK